MKKNILFLFVGCMFLSEVHADRIYMMNAGGFPSAAIEVTNAILAHGHTLTINNTNFSTLPPGFTSTCIDSVNGYDWLCFFGDYDFSPLLPQIQAYINTGGKVFYQYEIVCCVTSSTSCAAIISGLTGLTITPSAIPAMATTGGSAGPGWEAAHSNCCVTIFGDAYKCMDGIPAANQLNATSNLNGSAPPISGCLNFGFKFTTTDFVGAAHLGAFVGLGDYNIWYAGHVPFSFGGTVLDTAVINYFFPNASDTCYLFQPGCHTAYMGSCDSTPAPIAGFSTPVNAICPGTCIDFTNFTTSATSYQWLFPGGLPGSSTDVNPSTICYNTPGSYDVQLIATNANGSDTLVLLNYITVYPQPPPQGISQNGDTLFANPGAVSYQWYFNGNIINGATDYFYVAPTSGDYNVVATDSNGCEVEAAVFNVVAGLQSTVDSGRLTIFPNPVVDKVIIQKLKVTRETAVEISIYNMLGVLAVQLQTLNLKPETSIDVSQLPAGIYWLEVSDSSPDAPLWQGTKTFRSKFIKR